MTLLHSKITLEKDLVARILKSSKEEPALSQEADKGILGFKG